MIAPRTPSRFAWIASLMLLAGCGGNPPEVDTAETVRPEPPKPTPTPPPPPAPTPEASPAKDAPKG